MPRMGSVMTAAISEPCSAKIRSSAAASFHNPTISVSATARRHAGRPRGRRGRVGWPPLARAGMARPVDRVRPAVVVALEAEDLLAAGEGAGEPQRVLDALGAGVAEPQELHRRNPLGDRRRRLALEVVGEREQRAALAQGVGDGVDDGRRSVAEDQRPLAHHVVDVGVAVLVGHVRSLAAAHEHRDGQVARTRRARSRPHSPGEAPGCALEELAGTGGRLADTGIAHALSSRASGSRQAP